jgi:hypothetical protein
LSENRQSDPLPGQDGGSELAAAGAHLHRAEADLAAAHGAEEKAEHEIGEAVREIESVSSEMEAWAVLWPKPWRAQVLRMWC